MKALNLTTADITVSLPQKLTALTMSMVISTMMLTGCDKSKQPEPSATEVTEEKTQADHSNQNKDNHEKTNHEKASNENTSNELKNNDKDNTEKPEITDKEIQSKYTIGDGQATADMMAVSLFYTIQMMYSIKDNTLTPDNVTCIQQIDYTKSATTYQKFLKDKFTADEISQLDTFYATKLGVNLTNLANQQINKMAAMANVKGSIAVATDPKEEAKLGINDELALVSFSQTKVGGKLGKQIMGENYMQDGLVNYTLPALSKELEACNVKAPTKQAMDNWTVEKTKEEPK